VNWAQLRTVLEDEGLDLTELLHIAWALSSEHVTSIEIFSDNSNYGGWKIWKEDGLFMMEKVP
jgi:hypothetical protein